MPDQNWSSNPDIQLAKQVAVQKKAKAAIILWFADGKFSAASYGVNGSVCEETGYVVHQIMDAIQVSGYINTRHLSAAMKK